MVRQANNNLIYVRSRGSFRGRGRGAGFIRGRGGISKPPPLMSRPMPPPPNMRYPSMHHMRPMRPPPRGMDLPRPRMRGRMEYLPRGNGMRPRGPGRMRPPQPGPRGLGPPGPILGRLGPPGRPPFRPPAPLMRGRGRGRVIRGILPPPMPGMGPPPFVHPGRGINHNFRGRLRGRVILNRGRGRGAAVAAAAIKKTKKSAKAALQEQINKPWVTEAMKNEIIKKHKLLLKAKKTKNAEDREQFKEQRNKVTTMLREAKIEYIGAHPEEDVDKILADAAKQGNIKETNGEASGSLQVETDAPAGEAGKESVAEAMDEAEQTKPDNPEVTQVDKVEAVADKSDSMAVDQPPAAETTPGE